MLFVAICVDKPNHLELRKRTREAHLEFLGGLGDQLKLAGPLLSGPDQTPAGSILFLEAAAKEDISEILDQDPYAKAGLFEHSAIEPFNATIGAWLENVSAGS